MVENRNVPLDVQPGDLQWLHLFSLNCVVMQLRMLLHFDHYLNAGGAWRYCCCLVELRWGCSISGLNGVSLRLSLCLLHSLCAMIVFLYPVNWHSASVASGLRFRSFHGLVALKRDADTTSDQRHKVGSREPGSRYMVGATHTPHS